MHTQKLRQPIAWDGVPYDYGAVVLSGHNTRPVQIGYGQYEFTAKMPNRRGSWPAFWLISTAGWPPEIDIYEGFGRSEEHTSELQSLMRISYAVFCLKKKKNTHHITTSDT